MAYKKSKTKKSVKKKQVYDFYKLPRNEAVTVKVLPGIHKFQQTYKIKGKTSTHVRYAANVLIDEQSKIWIFGETIAKSIRDFYFKKALKASAIITVDVLFNYDSLSPIRSTYEIYFKDSEPNKKGQRYSSKSFAKEEHYIEF